MKFSHTFTKPAIDEIKSYYSIKRASQVVLVVKNLPANTGDMRFRLHTPGSGRSLEEGMATHSSVLT